MKIKFFFLGLIVLISLSHSIYAASSNEMNLPIKEINVFSKNKIWFLQDKTSPKIYIEVTFTHTGQAFAPPHKSGLPHLYGNLFTNPREGGNKKEFSSLISNLGLTILTRLNQDHLSFSFSFAKQNMDEVLEFIHKLFQNARFSEEDVNQSKFVVNSLSDSNPDFLARNALMYRCFPNHPYSEANGDLVQNMQTLRASDVEAFPAAFLDKEHLKVTIVGNIKELEVKKVATKLFGFLQEKRTFEGNHVPYKEPEPFPNIVSLYQDIPQSKIAFLYPMPKQGTKEYYFASVANAIWGGTQESKLFRAIRVKKGLVYGVNSYVEEMPASTYMIGATFTQNGQEDEVIQIIREKFQNLKKKGISKEELLFAQNHLTGDIIVGLISPSEIIGRIHDAHILGKKITFLGDYVKNLREIDLKELNDFLSSWVDSSKMSFSIVGRYAPKVSSGLG